jgi:hypothetical protein
MGTPLRVRIASGLAAFAAALAVLGLTASAFDRAVLSPSVPESAVAMVLDVTATCDAACRAM